MPRKKEPAKNAQKAEGSRKRKPKSAASAKTKASAKSAPKLNKMASAKAKPPKARIDPKADIARKKRRPFRWLFKWLAVVVVVLCLLPVLLAVIYIPSGVHPISTLMVSNWIAGEPVKRTWVSLDDISPFVLQSVVSSEDGQFCAHKGVDWGAVNTVIDDLMEGESPRGASTVSMQTVKNVFLWSSRSYVRKVLEVPLALMSDALWGKKRMMEIYLNIAEWGPGIYGIEAAAQHHFKRSAKRLTRKQAALLTVTLPNPKLRNPRKPGRGMRRLARLVEKRARASGAYVGCLK